MVRKQVLGKSAKDRKSEDPLPLPWTRSELFKFQQLCSTYFLLKFQVSVTRLSVCSTTKTLDSQEERVCCLDLPICSTELTYQD